MIVNSILASCPNFNCNFEILDSNSLKLVSFNQISSTRKFEFEITNILGLNKNDFNIRLADQDCVPTSIDPANNYLACDMPINNDNSIKAVAGTFSPIITIKNIGTVYVDPSIYKVTFTFQVNSFSPSSVS